jgi:O-Antigen ligase
MMSYVSRGDSTVGPPYVVITCLFLLLFAGRYSIGRLADPSDPTAFNNVSFSAGEVRNVGIVLFFGLLVTYASRLRTLGPCFDEIMSWSLWVVLLDVYLAAGALWVHNLDELTLYRAAELFLLALLQLSYVWVFSHAPAKGLDLLMLLCFGAGLVYTVAGMSGHWHLDQRATAFGGGPNVFVRVVGTGLLSALYLWAKTEKPFWVSMCPLFLLAAVLSGSRGGMLGLAVSLPVMLLTLRKRVRGIWIAFLGVGVVLLVVSATPTLLSQLSTFWQTRYIDLTFNKGYTSSRNMLFAYAWSLFTHHPLAGVGLNGFQQATGYIYPHNLVLNVACEGGLIGLTLLVIPFVIIVSRIFCNNTLEQRTCLSISTFYLIANMFSGTYYDARFMWLFLVLFLTPTKSF